MVDTLNPSAYDKAQAPIQTDNERRLAERKHAPGRDPVQDLAELQSFQRMCIHSCYLNQAAQCSVTLILRGGMATLLGGHAALFAAHGHASGVAMPPLSSGMTEHWGCSLLA